MSRTKYKRIPGFTKNKSPIYRSWSGMLRRCNSPGARDYKYYGGRGIRIYDRWIEFDNFYADMASSFLPGLTLDRIDVNGNYEPRNCRWITHKEQCINRRSTNFLTRPSDGKKQSLSDWARELGISRNTISSRVRLGYRDFESLCHKGNVWVLKRSA